MRIPDRISGLALALLGAAAFWGGLMLPPMRGQPVGPSAFPMVAGAGLVLVGLLIALGVGRRFEEAAAAELARLGGADPAQEAYAQRRRWHVLIPPALLIFYYLASERLGFVPVAAFMIGVLAYFLNADRRWILPVAIGGAVAVQLVFVKLLRVPLPAGLLPMPW